MLLDPLLQAAWRRAAAVRPHRHSDPEGVLAAWRQRSGLESEETGWRAETLEEERREREGLLMELQRSGEDLVRRALEARRLTKVYHSNDGPLPWITVYRRYRLDRSYPCHYCRSPQCCCRRHELPLSEEGAARYAATVWRWGYDVAEGP